MFLRNVAIMTTSNLWYINEDELLKYFDPETISRSYPYDMEVSLRSISSFSQLIRLSFCYLLSTHLVIYFLYPALYSLLFSLPFSHNLSPPFSFISSIPSYCTPFISLSPYLTFSLLHYLLLSLFHFLFSPPDISSYIIVLLLRPPTLFFLSCAVLNS